MSDTKPNGFVLRGHVTAPLAAGAAGTPGSACTATGVAAGTPVTVTDPAGKEIASGSLGPGVVAPGTSAGATCDFPFQIRAVPGGVASYGISVGGRPAQQFPAKALHEDQAAVITLSG